MNLSIRPALPADADFLAELADEVAWDVIHGARDEGSLDVDALEPLSDAVRSRVVRQWLVEGGCPPGRLAADHVQRVCRLVTHWKGQGPVALPGGVEAVRGYGRLALRQTTPRSSRQRWATCSRRSPRWTPRTKRSAS